MAWHLLRKTGLISFAFFAAFASGATAAELPRLDVVLAWRDGYLAVDASSSHIKLGSRPEPFQSCGLTPEAMKAELVPYLDALLRDVGPAFEQLVVPSGLLDATQQQHERARAELRTLAALDEETRQLQTLTADWPEAYSRVRRWWARHGGQQLAAEMAEPDISQLLKLFKSAEFHPRLGEGPLLPERSDPDADLLEPMLQAGRMAFRLLPPFVATDNRLRPDYNVKQWDALRQGLSDNALRPLRCKLWYRARVLEQVSEYLELRGLKVHPYAAPRDQHLALRLNLAAQQQPPEHGAGIAPERTRYPDPTSPAAAAGEYGGRVILMPDPTVQTVFIEAGLGGEATLWQTLYWLLPSSDFAVVRAQPGRYLCRTTPVWRVAQGDKTSLNVARMDLDSSPGSTLHFARLLLTPPELAARMQRLASLGLRAQVFSTENLRLAGHNIRRTKLIVEPAIGLTAPALPSAWPACTDAAAPVAAPPVAATIAPVLDPADSDAAQGSASRRSSSDAAPLRHELQLSLEKPSGKPVSLGLRYSQQGLQLNDRFSIGFGHQRKGSVDGSYSMDFVLFDRLARRLQLAASAYSTAQTDRPTDGMRSEERREGAALRASLDLWRTGPGSFGQASLGLARQQVTPANSLNAQPTVLLLDLTLIAAREAPLTSAAPHSEAVLMVGRGRHAGQHFGKASLELAHDQFVGSFERLDLRLRANGVGAGAPVSEWVAFGGEDSVRGYRSDWALVRHAVTLQAEYWMRLPGMAGNDKIRQMLRRNVALALFGDYGQTEPAGENMHKRHAGAGIGLRFVQGSAAQRLTLKLDLARPLAMGGALPPDLRQTRLHFSVNTRQSL